MKTQIVHLTAAVIVTVVVAVACQNVGTPAAPDLAAADTTLVGPTWQLVAFVEAGGDSILVNTLPEWGRNYTVRFTTDKRTECSPTVAPCGDWRMKVSGHPNEGGFSYSLDSEDNQILSIYFHGQTKVGTPPGAKEQEFFEALKATKNYRINGTRLRLLYGDGNALLFEPKKVKKE